MKSEDLMKLDSKELKNVYAEDFTDEPMEILEMPGKTVIFQSDPYLDI